MTDLALDLRHAEKTYRGGVRALRGVSMEVHRGEISACSGRTARVRARS
jgi:hypothetical protein